MPPNIRPAHWGSSPVWARLSQISLAMPSYCCTSCCGSTSPRNWGGEIEGADDEEKQQGRARRQHFRENLFEAGHLECFCRLPKVRKNIEFPPRLSEKSLPLHGLIPGSGRLYSGGENDRSVFGKTFFDVNIKFGYGNTRYDPQAGRGRSGAFEQFIRQKFTADGTLLSEMLDYALSRGARDSSG